MRRNKMSGCVKREIKISFVWRQLQTSSFLF
nr:MAG TPA: hypothetical protein [Caudoviricetes sp.]